MLDFVILEKTK